MITFEDIRRNKDIKAYIEEADRTLIALGYTEHSFPHVSRVSKDASRILEFLGYNEHDIELARIAGFMHDIGNLVNRVNHSQSGAIMAFRILNELKMDPRDIALITTAIGNHDEGTGVPVNPIAAALIIADKSDVRRSRVRNINKSKFDIHDRVNYSVTDSHIELSEKEITLHLELDTEISPVFEYFQIFLNRMIMCQNAAIALNMRFRLNINGQILM